MKTKTKLLLMKIGKIKFIILIILSLIQKVFFGESEILFNYLVFLFIINNIPNKNILIDLAWR